jgi:hypothetical protein
VRNAHILTPLQQEQQDNSRISCVFLVHAPQSACDYLNFSEDLPLMCRNYTPPAVLEDDDLLPADAGDEDFDL